MGTFDFLLPWAQRLGYPVPPFDFRVPGVTSMSADTHRYGYAPKGSSVILYRGRTLRRYRYYTAAEWPGGLYVSPTLAGSRPGALSAAAWAAMVSMGEEGYLEATRRILQTAEFIKAGLREIPELRILGDPLWVIAFSSDTLDIYRVMDRMTARGWRLNALHRPPAVHIAVTLRHTEPGVAQRFLSDLQACVALLRLTGVHREKLPDLKGALEILGGLQPQAARELGLEPGIPVVVGTPDVQSAALGAGATRDYQAHLYVGTSSWLTCHVPYKKTDLFRNMATLPSAIPGRYFRGRRTGDRRRLPHVFARQHPFL